MVSLLTISGIKSIRSESKMHLILCFNKTWRILRHQFNLTVKEQLTQSTYLCVILMFLPENFYVIWKKKSQKGLFLEVFFSLDTARIQE